MKITPKTINIIFKRLLVTIGIVFFLRIGTFFPVPGINQIQLAFYLQSHSNIRNLISTFSGNDTFVIGLFTLNIFPYINATIFTQFLVKFLPKLSKMQKEGDLESRRSINQLTRFITLIWALIQSTAVSFYLKPVLINWSYSLAFEIVLWLTTGAMIVLWLSDLITDYGLGNGSSILIYTNIISNLPNFSKKVLLENSENLSIFSKLEIVLFIFASLCGIVFLNEGIRTIPLISSKQLNQKSRRNSITDNNYLPLRFNQAGVMPIILTTALLVIPNYISQFGFFGSINLSFNSPAFGFIYWISYFGLILFFSSYYSSLVLNPKDISDQLQKMAVAIPGIRPGIKTTFYLKQIMNRVTLIGATMLAILIILPNFLVSNLSLTGLNGLGTTSLLILAGVILDLGREIKNIYYSNVYNNKY